jgi:hypothetical protein
MTKQSPNFTGQAFTGEPQYPNQAAKRLGRAGRMAVCEQGVVGD